MEKVNKTDNKNNNSDLITGTGRRKTAVASIFLRKKKGKILVNQKPIEEVYTKEKDILEWKKPFYAVGISHPESMFDISIKVHGSGVRAQLSAITHGLSSALSKVSDEYSKILRSQGMLTRDSRMVERKKPFLHKARKRPQFSKR